ncbi:LysR family transcriptional regulator [Litoreibacter roseus]|uniref:LysR family transcriptional regulator n=1 Tax=Litoreibacter roseus TaxID=2601869 RepID=A0A6N6JIK2_9RHOB|nr:LysR family transcriptional regulator [Litoreibacter roseus]GFE65118.1 LysR family transcriptional regulator [Litoreibacter roseus]
MQNDWNDLQIFLALERAGTARAAGERLKVSHSTVSRRLTAMEERFGTKLFDRTPDGFIPNASGARILARAQQIEAEMMELERFVVGNDIRLQGDIRLTAPPPVTEYLLLPMLEQFRDKYPLITIELHSTFGQADLSRRDADLAIRFSEKPDDHLVGRRLPEFRETVYASPDYIAAHWDGETPIDPAWIGWHEDGPLSLRARTANFPEAPTDWRMPDLNLHARAAVAGFGMASLPCMMGDVMDGIIRVPGATSTNSYPGWLLTHPDLRRMERVRVFAKFLAEQIVARSDFIGGSAGAG